MNSWMYIAGGAVMFLTIIIILFSGNKKKPAFDQRKRQRSLNALPDVKATTRMPRGVKSPKPERPRRGHNPPPPAGKRPPPPPNPPKPRSLTGKIVPGAPMSTDAILEEMKAQIIHEMKRSKTFAGSPAVVHQSAARVQMERERIERKKEQLRQEILYKRERASEARANVKEQLEKYLKQGLAESTLGIRSHPKRKKRSPRRGTSSGGPR